MATFILKVVWLQETNHGGIKRDLSGRRRRPCTVQRHGLTERRRRRPGRRTLKRDGRGGGGRSSTFTTLTVDMKVKPARSWFQQEVKTLIHPSSIQCPAIIYHSIHPSSIYQTSIHHPSSIHSSSIHHLYIQHQSIIHPSSIHLLLLSPSIHHPSMWSLGWKSCCLQLRWTRQEFDASPWRQEGVYLRSHMYFYLPLLSIMKTNETEQPVCTVEERRSGWQRSFVLLLNLREFESFFISNLAGRSGGGGGA